MLFMPDDLGLGGQCLDLNLELLDSGLHGMSLRFVMFPNTSQEEAGLIFSRIANSLTFLPAPTARIELARTD